MKNRFIIYWLVTTFLVILLGEMIIPPLFAGNYTFYAHFIPITLYYLVLCAVMCALFFKIRYLALITVFIYGWLAEFYIFKNIHSLFALDGIIFFGMLYIMLFWVPWSLLGRTKYKLRGN